MVDKHTVRWGASRAHVCGVEVQEAVAYGRMPTLFDAGTWTHHRCGPVTWCHCGEPVCSWRSGAVVNVADDLMHTCREPRATVRRVTVPEPARVAYRGTLADLVVEDAAA